MSAIVTSTRRWTLNYYITQWIQEVRQFGDQTRSWQNAVEKANTQQSGTPGPRLSSQGERERDVVMANKVRVNMLQFCSVSDSLSHTTLSIKWKVYFSKRLYRSLLLFCYVYASAFDYTTFWFIYLFIYFFLRRELGFV